MRIVRFFILGAVLAASPLLAQQPGVGADKAILWQDPGDIGSRNLFYGVGGQENVPKGPFTFVEEDKGGASAKFEIKDGKGEKWTAKVGPESQPEVAATRLLWALGFATNENYHLSEMPVRGITGRLKRGRKFVSKDDVAHGVRLQRHPKFGKKTDGWSWNKNPFRGTKEFDGLRAMMALLSNWDLKDDNNGIYQKNGGQQFYGVSDVGASFGTSGKGFTDSIGKNNLEAYSKHKFVSKVTDHYVSFNFPTHPSFVHYFPLFQFPLWWRHSQSRWIGRHIPREHVKWAASLLIQLSPDQIRDAFRAAGYSREQVEAHTAAVQARISEIARL